MTIRPSKLTTLAQQHSAQNHDILSRKSIEWLQKEVKKLRDPTAISKGILKERDRFTKRPLIGGLYFLYYEPKFSNKLPYYDLFPLVLVLERYNDGILGLNLHYLPPAFRALFLDKLLGYASYNDKDEIKRIKITYDILAGVKSHRLFKPCIKRYLNANMGTPPLRVEPNEWETAIFLPTHRFQKAKAPTVWKESLETAKE
jgi:hypothetical protein